MLRNKIKTHTINYADTIRYDTTRHNTIRYVTTYILKQCRFYYILFIIIYIIYDKRKIQRSPK